MTCCSTNSWHVLYESSSPSSGIPDCNNTQVCTDCISSNCIWKYSPKNAIILLIPKRGNDTNLCFFNTIQYVAECISFKKYIIGKIYKFGHAFDQGAFITQNSVLFFLIGERELYRHQTKDCNHSCGLASYAFKSKVTN
jgi:hypothetical protein